MFLLYQNCSPSQWKCFQDNWAQYVAKYLAGSNPPVKNANGKSFQNRFFFIKSNNLFFDKKHYSRKKRLTKRKVENSQRNYLCIGNGWIIVYHRKINMTCWIWWKMKWWRWRWSNYRWVDAMFKCTCQKLLRFPAYRDVHILHWREAKALASKRFPGKMVNLMVT